MLPSEATRIASESATKQPLSQRSNQFWQTKERSRQHDGIALCNMSRCPICLLYICNVGAGNAFVQISAGLYIHRYVIIQIGLHAYLPTMYLPKYSILDTHVDQSPLLPVDGGAE